MGVAVVGGVLVAECGCRGGVAEAVHEFGQGGSGMGGEDRAGVAQSCQRRSGRPAAGKRSASGWGGVCRSRWCCRAGVRCGVGDVAWSGGPFGGGDDVLAVDPGDGAVDVHDPGVEVEVFAAEFGDLSEPSAAPGGEQDNGLSS